MSWYATAFGAHYRWLYAHRDDAEAEACVAQLDDLVELREGPVLDLGCGAGRHMTQLARQGAVGAGLDLSSALLAEASIGSGVKGGAFRLLRGDMRALPFRNARFSAVLSLFTAFGYFGDLADHAGLVEEIARVLRPGGRWCLDFLNAHRVRAELRGGPVRDEQIVGPCRVETEKRLSEGEGRVEKRVRIRPLPGHEKDAEGVGVPAAGLDYVESVALFAPEELDRLAGRAGLERVGARGGYDGRPFDAQTSERWILVYERFDPEEPS